MTELDSAIISKSADERGVAVNAPGDATRPFSVRMIIAGFSIIALFLASLTIWSLLAPIESAVVAQGVVSADSSRRTVQHLEGGIIDAILVHEGDQVKAGEVLIRLDNTQHISLRNQLRARFIEARATEARLIAERDGKADITFPKDFQGSAADETIRAAKSGQLSIFQNRRKLLAERLAVLGQRVASLGEEISGLEGQSRSSETQLALTEEELVAIAKLYAKKLSGKPRLLALKRRKAEIEGEISKFKASMARAKQGILESRLKMAELRASALTEIVERLRKVRALAYELGQKFAAAEDVSSRSEIRSPIDGAVVGLKVHTRGGVIAAGQALLDVVPVNDKLVVRTSIDPRDIDQVQAGLPAHVELTAFNRRRRVPIEGKVKTVSADRLIDPQTGLAYYLALIELAAESPQFNRATLMPGMSADVMIKTGARTPMEYLLMPISRILRRALRES